MPDNSSHESTNVSGIPDDWKRYNLGDIIAGSPQYGLTASARQKGSGTRFLRTTDLKNYRVNWEALPFCRCTNEEYERFVLKKGDVVIARSGSVGVSVLVEQDKQAVYGSYMIRIRPQSGTVTGKYLAYFLQSALYWKQIYSDSKGSTMKNINSQTLRNLQVTLPPILEQYRIASVLSTIDEMIQKTDEIIGKTQQLKNGLMQQLLTRGIGHAETKKTTIGEIPKDWEVSTIGLECEVGSGGTPSRNRSDYFGGEIPWIKTTELDRNIIMSTEEKITKKGLDHSSAKVYPKGTLLIAMYGLEAPGTRGRCALLGIDAAVNQACAAIQSRGRLQVLFLFYYYQSLGDRIMSLTGGTKRQNLSLEIVKTIKVPVPSSDEQLRIAQMLSDLDERIEKENQARHKVMLFKNGLMQALLTGRLRVRVN